MAVERASGPGAPQPVNEASEVPKTLSWSEILARLQELDERLQALENEARDEELHDLGWEWSHPEYDRELDSLGKRRTRRIG